MKMWDSCVSGPKEENRQDCWGQAKWAAGCTAVPVECYRQGALSFHLRWLPTSCQILGNWHHVLDLNILPYKKWKWKYLP